MNMALRCSFSSAESRSMGSFAMSLSAASSLSPISLDFASDFCSPGK